MSGVTYLIGEDTVTDIIVLLCYHSREISTRQHLRKKDRVAPSEAIHHVTHRELTIPLQMTEIIGTIIN